MTDPDFETLMPLEELHEGAMRACKIRDREILLCRTRDGVFALDNVCTHAYARMSEGRLRGTRLICPLHGASFDVRDGRVLGAPAVQPLTAHEVRVEDGKLQVRLNPSAPKPSGPY